MGNAVESLYRDMERARSLFPQRDDDADAMRSPGAPPSEDWSVISDTDDKKSRRSSRHSQDLRQSPGKDKEKKGIVSTVMSVLPSRS